MTHIENAAGSDGMGWLEFISAIIGSVAWPIAAVILALVFKGHLVKLLHRMVSFGVAGATATFDRELDRAEAVADRIEEGVVTVTSKIPELDAAADGGDALNANKTALRDSEQVSRVELMNALQDLRGAINSRSNATSDVRFEDVAAISPRLAILDAWGTVNRALAHASDSAGLRTISNRSDAMPRLLEQAGKITPETKDLIGHLRSLRNTASHATESAFTLYDAERYQALARSVIEQLEQAGASGA